MEVFKPGQKVKIGDVEGQIVAVTIYPEGVEYKISWWNGSARLVEYMSAVEFEVADEEEKLTIGFGLTAKDKK